MFVSGHLGCFHFGTVVNHTAADMHVQVLCGHLFLFLLGTYHNFQVR